MTNRYPFILIGTALVVFALSYLVIAELTAAWRGVAAGVVLALGAGLLIWFAKTHLQAMARAAFSMGATCIAAPAAGLAAAQNDLLYGFIGDPDGIGEASFAQYEAAMALGLLLLGVGCLLSVPLFVIAWRLRERPIS